MRKNKLLKPITLALSSATMLAGCATASHPYDPNDPLQTINRGTFVFNQQFDKFLLKPLAQGYVAITPNFVRTGANNFFMNLNEMPTAINSALQLKPTWVLKSVSRLVINSTLGIGGLFDVAAHFGLHRDSNDFGTTLSKWGFSSSPYFVIPFLGPSNVRDGLGLLVDYEAFTVWPYMHNDLIKYSLLGFDMVRIRANLLNSEPIVQTAAFDTYTLMRDAYVQYRYQYITQRGGKYKQGASYSITNADLDFALHGGSPTSAANAVLPTVKPPLAKPTQTTSDTLNGIGRH